MDRKKVAALEETLSTGKAIDNDPEYLAGLWDYDGTNVVGATNQVTVADIDPGLGGPELIFAGFDGQIHAVDAAGNGLWFYPYTTDERVLAGGTAYISDLGMTGPYDSVLGRCKDSVIQAMVTAVPTRFEVAEGELDAAQVMLQDRRVPG